VASLKVHTALDRVGVDIPSGFGTVVGAITAAGAPPIGPPFLIFHDVIDEETDGDVEICIPVPAGEHTVRDGVEWKEIAGGTVAATTHRGPYDQVAPAYHSVTGWIQDHGHQITAAPREIYLNDPQTVSPDDLLTEVQFPIDAG
jgi:effector-binding domain-containing protein